MVLDETFSVKSGGGSLAHEDEASEDITSIEFFDETDGYIAQKSVAVSDGRENAVSRSPTVTAASNSHCSLCKDLYGTICGGIGCSLTYYTICYIFTGGTGYVMGACGVVAPRLCQFINKNSCEAGLNKVVCQLLGFCSIDSGEEPCEQYPDGVESPYCDA